MSFYSLCCFISLYHEGITISALGYIHTCMHAHIHTYIHTYIHVYKYTCIHTNISTCIHVHICRFGRCIHLYTYTPIHLTPIYNAIFSLTAHFAIFHFCFGRVVVCIKAISLNHAVANKTRRFKIEMFQTLLLPVFSPVFFQSKSRGKEKI